jgi:hypothetical protein
MIRDFLSCDSLQQPPASQVSLDAIEEPKNVSPKAIRVIKSRGWDGWGYDVQCIQ